MHPMGSMKKEQRLGERMNGNKILKAVDMFFTTNSYFPIYLGEGLCVRICKHLLYHALWQNCCRASFVLRTTLCWGEGWDKQHLICLTPENFT